jgi:superfamily II DNA or RNA helicase
LSMQLRPHQEQAITQLRAEIKRGSLNPVLAAPCSMGKTFIACEIMRRAAANNKRSVFFVDRNKLISQTTDTLDAMGLDYSVRQGDQFWLYDPDKLIQVVSIQTAARRKPNGL